MRLILAAFAVAFATLAPALHAQGYPTKPVRVILGYTTGGTADTLGRLVAENLSPLLGQNVIIENRPGASGNIAAQAVARATSDGYTLLFGNTGEMAINKHLMQNLGFDPDTDFAPVVLIHNVPLGLIVSASSPYRSLQDLLEAARREAGRVTFANSGSGSPAHFAGEMLALKAAVTMTQVPYKGAAPALLDLIGGRVDAYFLGLPAVMPHVHGGKVRLLAVSTAKRAASAPEVPSVRELGIPGFDFSLWGGIFAPAATAHEIVMRLNQAITAVLQRPEVTAQMARQGSEVIRTTPEEFGRFVQAESAKYGELVKSTK